MTGHVGTLSPQGANHRQKRGLAEAIKALRLEFADNSRAAEWEYPGEIGEVVPALKVDINAL
jgi:hypothetical protein